MKVSIRTNHYENTDMPNLKGFATLTFDDKYVLESVKILENKEKGELFVALPTIKVNPDKNDGNEYKEFFHPITERGRKGMNDAILKQFNDASLANNTTKEYDIGDKMSFRPSATEKNFFDYTKDNIVGIGSVKFGNDYVLENVQIKTKNDGNGVYIDTPNRKKGDDFVPYFHPITTEAAADLKEVCVNAFESYKAEKEKSYDWGEGVVVERTENNAAAAEKTATTPAMDNMMSDFEDIDASEFEDLDLTASNGLSR